MIKKGLVGLVLGLGLLLPTTMVMAADTSPYLIGVWEDDGQTIYTDFIIMNPALGTIDVYAVFFKNNGDPIEGKCFKTSLAPNAKWYLRGADLGLSGSGSAGTAKFVAVEQGERAYDKNLVIGGFQNRWMFQMSSSQANLNAVVLNKSTIAEIKEILKLECSPWASD
jgi:hypothetical protein